MGFLGLFVAAAVMMGMLAHVPGRRPTLRLLLWFFLLPLGTLWLLRLQGLTSSRSELFCLALGMVFLLLGRVRYWLPLGGATLCTAWLVWLFLSLSHPAALGLRLPDPPPEPPAAFTNGPPVTCQGVALGETKAALEARLGPGRSLPSNRKVLARYSRREYSRGVRVLFDEQGRATIVAGRHLEQNGRVQVHVGSPVPREFVPHEVELAEHGGVVTQCYLVRGRFQAGLLEPGEQTLSIDGVKLESTRAEVERNRRRTGSRGYRFAGARCRYPGEKVSLVVVYDADRVVGIRGWALSSGATVLGEGGEKPGARVIGSAYTRSAVAVAAAEDDGFSLRLPGFGEVTGMLRQDVLDL